jgi:hypothetical protein
MPQAQPKMDVFPIPNLKPQESFGNIPQLQNFPQTPRAILRNANTPKTLSFQEVLFYLGYQNGSRPSKNAPIMFEHRSLIPNF